MIRVSVVRGCWMEAVVKSAKSNVVILHTGTLCLSNKRRQKNTSHHPSRWSSKAIYRNTNKMTFIASIYPSFLALGALVSHSAEWAVPPQ